MGPKRPRFSAEYRQEAVRLTETGAKPLTQIARELGIHVETLRSWRRRYRATARATAPQEGRDGAVPSLEEENRRLRRENARLLEEREILKKATAFFAKESR